MTAIHPMSRPGSVGVPASAGAVAEGASTPGTGGLSRASAAPRAAGPTRTPVAPPGDAAPGPARGTLAGSAGRIGRELLRLPGRALLGLLWVYQRFVSPLTPPTCRFYPSCSQYAVIAIRRHGALRGGWLAVRRVGRCHPWNPGGVDDVPPRTTPSAHHDH